ncbi:MAG: hypothetical protein R3Y06_06655 [Faecalibacterium sp.]
MQNRRIIFRRAIALVILVLLIAAAENFTPLTMEESSDDSKNTLEYREQKSDLLSVIYAEIDALEALTQGEKNALSYQFDCALGWHW